MRLCNHTGFGGYKEFRKAVSYEMALREQRQHSEHKEIARSDSLEEIIEKITYLNILSLEETKQMLDVQVLHSCLEQLRRANKEIARSDSLEEIIEKITYLNILSLEETKQMLDVQVLHSCLEQLRRAKTIYLFGLGASLCAAKDAYLKFLRLNKLCIINEDWHSQLLQARNATPEDVALVISYSGATVEIIECMQTLKENKTPIIAITRCVESPVSQLADYKLYTSAAESIFRSGAMSSRMSQLNVVDIEIIECMQTLKENKTPIIAITRCVESPVSQLADYKLYTSAAESIFRSGAMSSRMSQLNVVDILYTAFANDRYEESLNQLSKTHIHKPDSPIGRNGK